MYPPVFEYRFRDGVAHKPSAFILELPGQGAPNPRSTLYVVVQRIEEQQLDGEGGVAKYDLALAFQAFDKDLRQGGQTHGRFHAYYDPFLNRMSLTGGGVYVPDLLQGRHVGTYLMNIVVAWAKQWPLAEIEPIELAAGDAHPDNHTRRNRFYEQFGLAFDYDDAGRRAGRSQPVHAGQLHTVSGWEEHVIEHQMIAFLRTHLQNEWMLASDVRARQKAIRELAEMYDWAQRHPFLALYRALWHRHRRLLEALLVVALLGSVAWHYYPW